MNKIIIGAIFLFIITFSVKADINNYSYSAIKVKKIILPTLLVSAGFISWASGFDNKIKKYRDNKFSDFNNKLDDYSQFFNLGLSLAVPTLGLKPKNNARDRHLLEIESLAITLGATYSLKYIINRARPSRSSHSFPSGHTSFAFMGAEILHQEYKESNPWLAYMGYGIATQVAIFRVLNNKHWFGDVLAGAGIGIMGAKIVYLTNKYVSNKFNISSEKITILPDFYNKTISFSLSF